MTEEQLTLIGHALGINVYGAIRSTNKKDKKLPKEFYRNRFCAGSKHSDIAKLYILKKMGYMDEGIKINEGRDTMWFVTKKGEQVFRECWATSVI